MSTNHDLSALLPDPPPPRPARREAALAEALRRFDGQAGAAPSRAGTPPPRARPSWARPQVAALASVALVVLVSVPIWWAERDRILPAAPEPAPPAAQATSDIGPAPSPSPRVPPPPAATQPAEPELADRSASTADVAPAEFARDSVALPLPPPPPPVAAVQAPPPAAPAQRAAAAAPAAPRARQEAAETAADEDDSNIVVTGSRVDSSGYEARAPIPAVTDAAPLDGEWNACTLQDPRRNPTKCRDFAGRAAAQFDDGLTLAWQGELDRAIRAFDRTIVAEPDLALAYLNRGLAWQAKGDLDRALADLNRAVARDRTAARAYYHRSRLHRARGDARRADDDARRAVELDPAYAAALP